MAETVRKIKIGAATISVINVGDMKADLTDWLKLSQDEWSPTYAEYFEGPFAVPVLCVHIKLPEVSVLVDAGSYNLSPSSPDALPAYQPPPDLLDSLDQVGVLPEEIDHVIITHEHYDHYNGATIEKGVSYTPCFPNARHYIGRSDWESPKLQKALQDPDSTESHTLGVLRNQGLLEMVDGNRNLGNDAHGNDIRIIAAPGETPGHQILRVHTQGETLYCLGDLYHHPVEVEQPQWTVNWADVDANLNSRRALEEVSPTENALLIATHIPTIGRLERTESGVAWVEV